MIYKMKLADSVDEMTFDLLEVPIEDKDVEGTADNTTIDGNVFTDYLWLKKQFVQKWSLMCEDDYTQLRGFYTRQWENAEVPTYKLYYGDDISTDNTLSGDYIALTNNTNYNAPILDFELDGNATQQTYSGKNLFPNITWTPRVAYPVANSGGIAWWTGYCGFQDYVSVLPNTTYTFSNAENEGFTYGLQFYDSDKTWISGINNTTKTFTTPADCHYIRGSIDIATAPTNVQLELGSTATAYEPYVGGTASPNPDYPQNIDVVSGEQTVKIEGKNLLGESHDNFGINATDGTVMQLANRYALVARIQEGQTYTTSRSAVGASTYFWVGFFAEKPVIGSQSIAFSDLGASTLQRTLTAPTGAKYCAIFYGAGTSPDCQLELGSTATAYEPYQGQEYDLDLGSIELAKIGNYQDRIYKTDGKWYIEKQVGKVDLSTLVWGAGSAPLYSTTSITDIKYTSTNTELGAILAEKYIPHIGSGMSTATGCIAVDVNAVRVNDTSTPSGLAYYALATPTTTEITEQALIDQLEAIVNATLPTGENNIMLIPSMGAQGSMEIEYKLIISQETIIYDTTPVRLNLTDGGVINPCGCRQNVQLTMRETIQ